MQAIYGDLAEQERFASAFEKWLSSMYANGVAATIKTYLDQA